MVRAKSAKSGFSCQRRRVLKRVQNVIIERPPDLVPPSTVVDFDDFYAEHARRTVAVAYALTGDWGAAEDLTQEAFLAASRRWTEIRDYEDPGAWVRRLVTNRSVSRWRRLVRESAAVARLSRRISDVAADPELADPEFWVAVHALPPQQARAVVLHYVDDRSVEDIAAVLGCSEGSVKTHLSRARHTLAERLGGDRP